MADNDFTSKYTFEAIEERLDMAGTSVQSVEQTLTSEEKQQARANIGAAESVAIVVHESNVLSNAQPNVLHVWEDISSLTVSSLAATSGASVVEEFMFRFSTSADWVQTTNPFPQTVRWSEEPDFEANTTYEVSIVNNFGLISSISDE